MPKFLEKKLKREYGADSAIPYKIMNKMGVMHGNRITPKGEDMDARHNAMLEEAQESVKPGARLKAALRKKRH